MVRASGHVFQFIVHGFGDAVHQHGNDVFRPAEQAQILGIGILNLVLAVAGADGNDDDVCGVPIEHAGLGVGGHGRVVDEYAAVNQSVVLRATGEVEGREVGWGGRSGAGDVADPPVEVFTAIDFVTLEE